MFAPLLLAAEETEHVAEEASGLDLLLPRDINEIIAGVIAFVIVFGFIWKYAAPALNEMLENRQKAIKADLEAAEAEKVEATVLKEDYAAQLSGARDEATRIVEDARQAGEAARADIVSRASGEAEAIKARAKQELVADREAASIAMRREVAGLSLDVAEKLVGRNLDQEGQQALVDEFIDQLGGTEA
ncbi:MAG: F0F1 ATP synthase subunit B [Actinomycetota bacterium]|nr:F0F1 ATP synthase subunit B [Actinomycetota bacterium]